MRKQQKLRKVTSPKITQEVLDPGIEPRTFKYLIVYHIYFLDFLWWRLIFCMKLRDRDWLKFFFFFVPSPVSYLKNT